MGAAVNLESMQEQLEILKNNIVSGRDINNIIEPYTNTLIEAISYSDVYKVNFSFLESISDFIWSRMSPNKWKWALKMNGGDIPFNNDADTEIKVPESNNNITLEIKLLPLYSVDQTLDITCDGINLINKTIKNNNMTVIFTPSLEGAIHIKATNKRYSETKTIKIVLESKIKVDSCELSEYKKINSIIVGKARHDNKLTLHNIRNTPSDCKEICCKWSSNNGKCGSMGKDKNMVFHFDKQAQEAGIYHITLYEVKNDGRELPIRNSYSYTLIDEPTVKLCHRNGDEATHSNPIIVERNYTFYFICTNTTWISINGELTCINCNSREAVRSCSCPLFLSKTIQFSLDADKDSKVSAIDIFGRESPALSIPRKTDIKVKCSPDALPSGQDVIFNVRTEQPIRRGDIQCYEGGRLINMCDAFTFETKFNNLGTHNIDLLVNSSVPFIRFKSSFSLEIIDNPGIMLSPSRKWIEISNGYKISKRIFWDINKDGPQEEMIFDFYLKYNLIRDVFLGNDTKRFRISIGVEPFTFKSEMLYKFISKHSLLPKSIIFVFDDGTEEAYELLFRSLVEAPITLWKEQLLMFKEKYTETKVLDRDYSVDIYREYRENIKPLFDQIRDANTDDDKLLLHLKFHFEIRSILASIYTRVKELGEEWINDCRTTNTSQRIEILCLKIPVGAGIDDALSKFKDFQVHEVHREEHKDVIWYGTLLAHENTHSAYHLYKTTYRTNRGGVSEEVVEESYAIILRKEEIRTTVSIGNTDDDVIDSIDSFIDDQNNRDIQPTANIQSTRNDDILYIKQLGNGEPYKNLDELIGYIFTNIVTKPNWQPMALGCNDIMNNTFGYDSDCNCKARVDDGSNNQYQVYADLINGGSFISIPVTNEVHTFTYNEVLPTLHTNHTNDCCLKKLIRKSYSKTLKEIKSIHISSEEYTFNKIPDIYSEIKSEIEKSHLTESSYIIIEIKSKSSIPQSKSICIGGNNWVPEVLFETHTHNTGSELRKMDRTIRPDGGIDYNNVALPIYIVFCSDPPFDATGMFIKIKSLSQNSHKPHWILEYKIPNGSDH